MRTYVHLQLQIVGTDYYWYTSLPPSLPATDYCSVHNGFVGGV